MWAWIFRLLAAGGVTAGAGAGVAGFTAAAYPKILAGVIEILAGVLDAVGCIFLLAFILGWRAGGEKLAIVWPLSLILEVVAYELWVL